MTEYGESILNVKYLQQVVAAFKDVLEWGSGKSLSVFIKTECFCHPWNSTSSAVEFAMFTVPPLEDDEGRASRYQFKDEDEMIRFLMWLEEVKQP